MAVALSRGDMVPKSKPGARGLVWRNRRADLQHAGENSHAFDRKPLPDRRLVLRRLLHRRGLGGRHGDRWTDPVRHLNSDGSTSLPDGRLAPADLAVTACSGFVSRSMLTVDAGKNRVPISEGLPSGRRHIRARNPPRAPQAAA